MHKPRTKKSIIKWVLLSVVAVILVLVLVAFLYVKLKLIPKIDEYMNDPEIASMLNELEQEDMNTMLDSVDGALGEEGVAPSESPAPTEQPAPTAAPKSTKAPAKSTNRIDEIKSQIPASDMAAATALASKVDPGYILGLLSGGLTIEEKRELKAYLQARLSGAEINKGIALYNKYSYLLR